jgi:hypothetical protein
MQLDLNLNSNIVNEIWNQFNLFSIEVNSTIGLRLNCIEFNNWIRIKLYWIQLKQMECKLMKYVFKIFFEYAVGKEKL